MTAACRSEHAKLCGALRSRRGTSGPGERTSASRCRASTLGLQNSSAMAHQTRDLPQLRIKFYNTVAAGLQIVLLLTVLPQGKFAGTRISDILRLHCVYATLLVMIFFIARRRFKNEKAQIIFLQTIFFFFY